MKMKEKITTIALLMSCALCTFGRTVSVASLAGDASGRTKSAVLSLTVGGSGYLYLAYGKTDHGDDVTAWEHVKGLGIVPPMATSVTCEFPVDADGCYSKARFFLLDRELDESVTRYEYLAFDGTQYLNTATPTSLTGMESIEMTLSFSTVAESMSPFCSRPNGAANNSMTLFYLAGSGWRYDYDTNGTAAAPVADAETKYSILANGTGLYVNDSLISPKTPKELTTLEPLWVFAARNASGSPVYNTKGKLYSFRLWTDDSTLKYDLIPTATNGVACFYDKVGKRYLGHSGAGALVCGPEQRGIGVLCQTDTLSGLFGSGRLLEVTASRRDGRERLTSVSLGIGAGPERWLYAGCGASDAGDDLEGWDALVELERVAASDVACTNEVLATSLPKARFVRFFLLDKDYFPGENRLDCVKVGGTQHVQTDFVPNQDSAVELEVEFDSVDVSQTLFCARGAYTDRETCTLFYLTGGNGWRFDFNTWMHVSGVVAEACRRYAIRTGTYSLDVDGKPIFPAAEPPSGFVASGKLALFASHERQTNYGNHFRGKLYSFRAWSNATDRTTMCLDLIPCKKDGVACLYNKVDGRYLQGNVALEAGEGTSNAMVFGAVETLEARPQTGLVLICR